MTAQVDEARTRLGALGLWCVTEAMTAREAADLACRTEALGYSALWLPETMGRDPFAHAAHLAAATRSLTLATGVANIHHRHPGVMHQAAQTLAEQSDGRFVLGLGVSHAPLVEGVRNLPYTRPLAAMREYLDGMDDAPYLSRPPADPPLRVLAALGPKMLELARDRADGSLSYWTTPTHTAIAREALGPDRLLCVEQKVVLSEDPDTARETARQALAMYANLPNYRNCWLRLGFSDAQIDERKDDFVDALVAWGDADAAQARIEEHRAAGADHICVQLLPPGQPFGVDFDALEIVAKAAVAARATAGER